MFKSSSLIKFFRHQALYLSVAAILASFFWANGQRINPAIIVLYTLCFGNMITPPMNRVRSAVAGRAFPYNWLIFLGTLIVLTPIVYMLASVVVIWLAPPYPQTLEHQ